MNALPKLRIGLVGCGAIGRVVARGIEQEDFPAELVGVTDAVQELADKLSAELPFSPPIMTLPDLVAASNLVVEAVTPQAAPAIVEAAIKGGRDIMMMSVGALVMNPALMDLAKEHGRVIHASSGAIAGLDGVKSAAQGKLRSVTITTRKPPNGFRGVEEVERQGIDLDKLDGPHVLFEGPAREAIKKFPASVNVSSALSLAGLGADRTTVRVVVDPEAQQNVHEIQVEGDFGRLTTRTENVPSPDNPKTSYLAALSALATLKRIADPVRIGT